MKLIHILPIFMLAMWNNVFSVDFTNTVTESVTADEIHIDVATQDAAGVLATEGNNIQLLANSGNITVKNYGGVTDPEIAAVLSTGGNITFTKNGTSGPAENPISIISTNGYAVAALNNGRIDFSNAIYVESHLDGIHAANGGYIRLTGMTHGAIRSARYILSANGGTIDGGASAEYVLDGRIYAYNSGIIRLTMDQSSIFTGSTGVGSTDNDLIDITLQGESIWNITQLSTLTSLNVKGGTSLVYNFENGDKANPYTITTKNLPLESEAQLVFNIDGSTIGVGDSFKLFDVIPGGNFNHNGPAPTILTADGRWEFIWETDDWQTYYIREIIQIPEPSSSILLLTGLFAAAFRRRKNTRI